ncbi:RNA methyltransferase [uncultured Rikenella sp.]|uniref:TrmH family RNA methyltransferase n=1 Tax=uncultured Rikenella sp. TaxID=368003 RepID=UPI00261D8158|nr:RNA methyltransferase [uncultured Rikenella sp.]
MLTKAEIKRIRSLGDKASRRAEGLFVAEGEKLVGELLASGFSVRAVYRVGENVSPAEMGRISFLRTPTPVLAVAEIPSFPEAGRLSAAGLALALDDVQDPGNLGTILRLADWFGVRDVYCSPATADCWSPKVVQATMGAILRVRVHYGPLLRLLGMAADEGLPVYGTFLEGENIYTCGLSPDKGLIVMGNEGRGVSREIAARVTRKLFIPPYPPSAPATAESLNVATATGIVLSEFRRRGA